MNYFEQMVKIYNTLTLVSTRGEDTVIMGQCLAAFKDILTQMQNANKAEASNTVEAE